MTSSVEAFVKTVMQLVGLDCKTATERVSNSSERAADQPMIARVVHLARVSIANLHKIALLSSTLAPMVLVVACGGSPQQPISDEPVSARGIVTEVQLLPGADRADSITVRTDDGQELFMLSSANIDPGMWDPIHLQGHQKLGELGVQIGVTYTRTPEGIVATALSE